MNQKINKDNKKNYTEASKSLRNYVIMGILIRNPGKFNIIPALKGSVILDGDISAENVKLPKGCRIEIDNTDSYRETSIGTIYKDDKRIAAFWGKTKKYISTNEASVIIDELEKLNDGNLVSIKKKKRFVINTDMYLSDIKFPDGVSYRIIYNPSEDDQTYQCQMVTNDNLVFPGILNCKAKEDDKVAYPGVLVDKKNSDDDDKNFVL